MSSPTPPTPPSAPTSSRLPSRRRVLTAGATIAAAAVVSSCATPWGRLSVGGASTVTVRPDADHRALTAALRRLAPLEVDVQAEVSAAAAGPWGSVASALGQQIAALGGPTQPASPTAGPSRTATATSSPTRSPSPSGQAGPVGPRLTQAAADARRDLPDVSGPVARLLACVAAGDDAAVAALAVAAGAAPVSLPTATRPSSAVSAPEARALAAALAAEQACVYGYGVLAVRLTDADHTAALADLAAHERRVDDLRARLLGVGRTPAPAAPGWDLPAPVHDVGAARTLALRLERACEATAADLVAASAPQARTWSAVALARAALRASSWRDSLGSALVEGLPGLTDRPA